MITTKARLSISALCGGALLYHSVDAAQRTALQTDSEFSMLFGEEEFVSIATGRKQPLSHAPAVATVITAQDIEAIGATDMSEILDLVPGFNSLFRHQGDQWVFRGIRTEGNFSPDVLVMIDGIPQNDIHLANQRRFISRIPLVSIDRIEVIRGPYSTLYGTDALAGVVNIITKRPEPDASQGWLRGGTFDTAEARWLQQLPLGDGALLSLQLRSTDGHSPPVRKDTQSRLDEMFGTNASLAPGNGNTEFDDYTAMLDYVKNDWRFRLRARGRDAGLGVGLFGALDPHGSVSDQQYNVEAHYFHSGDGDWDFKTDISFLHYEIETQDVTAYPPGVAFVSQAGEAAIFPDGIIDNPGYKEQHFRLASSLFYKRFGNHLPQLGLGVEFAEIFDVTETRNYLADPVTGLPAAPLPAEVEVEEDQRFSQDASRTLWYAYIQDEWTFAPDWTLTAGVRLDHYSDVGDAINPRAALVWTTTPTLTSKLLAGRGFRAPTLFELHAQSNPSSLGNEDLEPVTISSIELAFNVQPTHRLNLDLSIYRHSLDDIVEYEPIDPTGLQAQNGTGQSGRGVELAARWRALPRLHLSGYYAHHRNERHDTNDDNSLVPHNKFKLRLDWQPTSQWRANVVIAHLAEQKRPADNPRPPTADYTMVDLNLIFTPVKQWTLGLKINNALDEEAVAPEERRSEDTPLPGRAFFVDLKYRY